MTETKDRIANFLQSMLRYLGIVWRVVSLGWSAFPFRLLLFIVLEFISTVATLASAYIGFRVVGATLSKNVAEIQIFGFKFIDNPLLVLGIVVGIFLIPLLIGSSCRYLSRSSLTGLIRELEHQLYADCVEFISALTPRQAFLARNSIQLNIKRVVLGDTRLVSFAFRAMSLAILPALTLLILLPAFLYFQPISVGIVLLITALSLPFYIYNNKSAARVSSYLEDNAGAAVWYRRQVFTRLLRSPHRILAANPIVKDSYNNSKSEEYFDNFERRLRLIDRNTYMSSIVSIMCMTAFMFWTGYHLFITGKPLSLLIVYAGILRLAYSSVIQIAASAIALSRFFPSVERYFDLAQAATTQKTNWQMIKELPIKVHDLNTMSFRQIELAQPGRIGMVSPEKCSKFSFLELESGWTPSILPQLTNTANIETVVAFDKGGVNKITIKEGIGNVNDELLTELKFKMVHDAEYQKLTTSNEVVDIIRNIQANTTDKHGQTDKAFNFVNIILAATRTCRVIFLDASIFKELEEDTIQTIMNILANKYVVICGGVKELSPLSEWIEKSLISDGSAIVAELPTNSLASQMGDIGTILRSRVGERSFDDPEFLEVG